MPARAAGGNCALRRIGDHAQDGKRQRKLGGNPRHDMAFHIGRRRRRSLGEGASFSEGRVSGRSMPAILTRSALPIIFLMLAVQAGSAG